MAIKLTLKRNCERCGAAQLKFTDHNTVWRWHECAKPVPGPQPVPQEFRLCDVVVEQPNSDSAARAYWESKEGESRAGAIAPRECDESVKGRHEHPIERFHMKTDDQRHYRTRYSWRVPFCNAGKRPYRWPLWFRMNRFDWAWRTCL